VRYLVGGITLFIAAVPEGLPLSMTLNLINSTSLLLKQKDLIKSLDTIEKMGSCDTLIIRVGGSNHNIESINTSEKYSSYALMVEKEINFKK
jgi:hypothetical protein